MTRVVQLIDADASYQNRTAAEQLARGANLIASMQIDAGLASVIGVWKRTRKPADCDLIHAFGPRALAAAAMVGTKTVYTPDESPSPRAARWLRAITSHRDIQVVCTTDTTRRFVVERGVPIERCHLIRPAVDFSKIKG